MSNDAGSLPSARDSTGEAQQLAGLIADLPGELRRLAVTHASWVEERVESYGRLAFLGDAVLGLALAEHLYETMPEEDIGQLTKVHGQAVSGRACAELAKVLQVHAMVSEAEPDPLDSGIEASELHRSERAMSSITEAMIGACYLEHGLGPTAEAVIAAFTPQIELAAGNLLDFKSALQEQLAGAGRTVDYEVISEDGPPHDRRFEVRATVDSEPLGTGTGSSKKQAEQAAASAALEALEAGV